MFLLFLRNRTIHYYQPLPYLEVLLISKTGSMAPDLSVISRVIPHTEGFQQHLPITIVVHIPISIFVINQCLPCIYYVVPHTLVGVGYTHSLQIETVVSLMMKQTSSNLYRGKTLWKCLAFFFEPLFRALFRGAVPHFFVDCIIVVGIISQLWLKSHSCTHNH